MSTRPLPVEWFESTCQLPPTTPIAPRAQPAIFVPATLLPLSSSSSSSPASAFGAFGEEAGAVMVHAAAIAATTDRDGVRDRVESGRHTAERFTMPPCLLMPPLEAVASCQRTSTDNNNSSPMLPRASLLRCVNVPSEAHVAMTPLPSGQTMRCGDLCFVPLEVHEGTQGSNASHGVPTERPALCPTRGPTATPCGTWVMPECSPTHSPCLPRRETTRSSSASLSSSITTMGSTGSTTTTAVGGTERPMSHVLVPVVMLAAPPTFDLGTSSVAAVPPPHTGTATPSWGAVPPLQSDPSASHAASSSSCPTPPREATMGGTSAGTVVTTHSSAQAVLPLMTAIQQRPMCLVSTPPCPPRMSTGQMHVACRALPPEEADMECMICLEKQLPGRAESVPAVEVSGQRSTSSGHVRQDPRMVRLSCAHCFHVVCLQRWLLHATQCPLCRRDLAPPSQ